MSTKGRVIVASLAAFLTAGIVIACASAPDTAAVTNIYTTANAFSDFAGGGSNVGVVTFLAYRCGTLDCHGQIGRPLRIFSQDGLRLVDDAQNVSGGGATTESEIFADYTSAIGVQPELTSRVFAGLADPHSLLLLRKPLGLERHKGGTIFSAGSDSDNCITSWLESYEGGAAMNYQACKNAASTP
jgi:hypothetical protein